MGRTRSTQIQRIENMLGLGNLSSGLMKNIGGISFPEDPRTTVFYDSLGNYFKTQASTADGYNDQVEVYFTSSGGVQDMSTDGCFLLKSTSDAAGGSNFLIDDTDADEANWTRSTLYSSQLSALTSNADTSDCITLFGGTNDANASGGITKAKYKQGLSKLKEFIQADFVNAQFVILNIFSRIQGSTADATAQAVKDAQIETIAEDSFFRRGIEFGDQDFRDASHPTDAAFAGDMALRQAKTLARYGGKTGIAGVFGPSITAASFDTESLTLTVSHDLGTALTLPDGSTEQMGLDVDGTIYEPSSYEQDGNSLRLVFEDKDFDPEDLGEIKINYGAMGYLSQTSPAVILDNATDPLPLQTNKLTPTNNDPLFGAPYTIDVIPQLGLKTYSGDNVSAVSGRGAVNLSSTSATTYGTYFAPAFYGAGALVAKDNRTAYLSSSNTTMGAWNRVYLVLEVPASVPETCHIFGYGSSAGAQTTPRCSLLLNTDGTLSWFQNQSSGSTVVSGDIRNSKVVVCFDHPDTTTASITVNEETPVTFDPRDNIPGQTRFWFFAGDDDSGATAVDKTCVGLKIGRIWAHTAASEPSGTPSVATVMSGLISHYRVLDTEVQFDSNFRSSMPFKVSGASVGNYTHTYNAEDDKPTGLTVAYLSESAGDNGSAALNDTNQPYETIAAAITAGARDLRFKDGSFDCSIIPAYSLILQRDTGTTPIYLRNQITTPASWVQQSSPNASVYVATGTTGVGNVLDTTENVSGLTQIDGSTGVHQPYSKKTSVAEVQAEAGSFYDDGADLYIHTWDSAAPVVANLMLLNDSDVIATNAANGQTIYLEGLEVWGSNPMEWTSTDSSSLFVAKDCGFRYAEDDECIDMRGVPNRLVNVKATHSRATDTISYTGSGSYRALHAEFDCEGRFAGYDGTGNTDNGSTCHVADDVVRVNGVYDNNRGINLEDVTGSQTYNLGVDAPDSLAGSGGLSAGFGTGQPASDETVQWLRDCRANGSDRGRIIASGTSMIDLGGFISDAADVENGDLVDGTVQGNIDAVFAVPDLLVAHYDASLETVGALATFTDRSGNGNDFTQGTAADQPTVTSSAINGLNALDFDGSTDHMIGPSALYTTPTGDNTIIMVIKTDDTSSFQRIWAGSISNGSRWQLDLRASGTNGVSAVNSTSAAFRHHAYTVDTTARIIHMRRVGSAIFVGVDGNETESSGAVDVTIDGLALCEQITGGDNYDGLIGEIKVFSTGEASNLTSELSALSTKWGTP